ncbi:unnamed protein product [Brassica oleracea var. botrytis]|uniref:(rape) hypothetical protein n=1 Tax=Brassica napus TaxID=3708 RepID=A0A816JBW2_BRANA|nr:unnamed protein product [Brassica napus]
MVWTSTAAEEILELRRSYAGLRSSFWWRKLVERLPRTPCLGEKRTRAEERSYKEDQESKTKAVRVITNVFIDGETKQIKEE